MYVIIVVTQAREYFQICTQNAQGQLRTVLHHICSFIFPFILGVKMLHIKVPQC